MNAKSNPKKPSSVSLPPLQGRKLYSLAIRYGCVIGTSLSLVSCTADEMAAFNQGLAQANVGTQNGYNGSTNYNTGYNTGTYSNSGYNSNYNNNFLNQWVNQGFLNSDGSYSSYALKVNSRGEAYTRDTNGEYVRNPAYD